MGYFLINKDYDFGYLLGLSGTPYIKNDYFHDIIYRYGLRQATEDEIVKRVDYKLEEADQDKGFPLLRGRPGGTESGPARRSG